MPASARHLVSTYCTVAPRVMLTIISVTSKGSCWWDQWKALLHGTPPECPRIPYPAMAYSIGRRPFWLQSSPLCRWSPGGMAGLGRDCLPMALGLVVRLPQQGWGMKVGMGGTPRWADSEILVGALASPVLHQRNPHVDAGEGHHTGLSGLSKEDVCLSFISGRAGCLSLHVGFLQLPWVGATLCCGARACVCGGCSGRRRRVQVRGLLRGCHVGSAAVAHGLSTTGSIVVAHELIFTNLGPLHWHVDSLSLDLQRSPSVDFCLTSSEQGRVHPVHLPTTHWLWESWSWFDPRHRKHTKITEGKTWDASWVLFHGYSSYYEIFIMLMTFLHLGGMHIGKNQY